MKNLTVAKFVGKNRKINVKQLQESIEIMNELLRLGMYKGPNYKLGSPYADGLHKAEPNIGNSERKLRFERS